MLRRKVPKQSGAPGPGANLDQRLAAAMASANADRVFAYFRASAKFVPPAVERARQMHAGSSPGDPSARVRVAGELAGVGMTSLLAGCEIVGDGEELEMDFAERLIFDSVAMNVRDLGESGLAGVQRLQQRVMSRMVGHLDQGLDWSKAEGLIGLVTLTSAARGLLEDAPTGAEMGVAMFLMDHYGLTEI